MNATDHLLSELKRIHTSRWDLGFPQGQKLNTKHHNVMVHVNASQIVLRCNFYIPTKNCNTITKIVTAFCDCIHTRFGWGMEKFTRSLGGGMLRTGISINSRSPRQSTLCTSVSNSRLELMLVGGITIWNYDGKSWSCNSSFSMYGVVQLIRPAETYRWQQ